MYRRLVVMSEPPTAGRKITLAETGDLVASLDDFEEGGPQRRFGLLIFCDAEAQLKLLDEGNAVVVGRDAPSEILVNDASVSRQHARFVRKDGEVWVEDLDSRNGTFLRGKRIERERLEPADEIGIGKVRVVLAATRSPASLAPPTGAPAAHDVVIQNPRMQRIYREVAQAARGKLPVLVLGETGTGKELVARAVHRHSDRKDRAFVAVNCAAIPPTLLESTLFGHERGAFTGANGRTIGVFERAHGGVLFLDEIGDLGSSAQVALLRAIETRRISRVGSSTEIPIDVLLVAATHCDLEAMVEEGTFRKDLYFRLNGIKLDLPPLRERADEIEPLVQMFLAEARREWGVRARELTQEAMDMLRACQWPGNVRQLRYAVERATLLAAGDTIGINDLPDHVSADVARAAPELATTPIVELALKQQLRRYESLLIEEALRRAAGNRQAAAKLLRIPLRTLFRKLRATGLNQATGKDEDA
jgi:DNA-binding NtrC family response regulator